MMTEISFATDFGGGFGENNSPTSALESVEEARAIGEASDTVSNNNSNNPAFHDEQRSKQKKQKKKSKRKKSKKSSRSHSRKQVDNSSLQGLSSSSKLQDSCMQEGSNSTKLTVISTEQGSSKSWAQDDEWLWSETSSLHGAAASKMGDDGAPSLFYDDDHLHNHEANHDLLLLQDCSTNGDNRTKKPAFVEIRKSEFYHDENNATWTDDLSVAEFSKFEAFAVETTAQSVAGDDGGYGDTNPEKEAIHHTLVNYLTVMGLDSSKATDVASSFMSAQQQDQGQGAAAHASSRAARSSSRPVNPDDFAHEMREIEQNRASRGSATAPKRPPRASTTSGTVNTSRASSVPLETHLQGARRMPSTDDMSPTRQGRHRTSHSSSDDMVSTGQREGRSRTSFCSSNDVPGGRPRRTSGSSISMAAAAAAVTTAFTDVIRPSSRTGASSTPGEQRRHSSRRTTTPRRMVYQRAERPGAMEVSGRAFGAPRRPDASLASSDGVNHNAPTAMAFEAMAVEDFDKLFDNDIVAVHAKPLSLMHALKERSLRRLVICGLILAAAAVIGIVSFFMTRPDPGPSTAALGKPTMAPSFAPTFIHDDVLVAAAAVSGWDYDRGPNDAQLQAVGWLSAVDDIMDRDNNFGPDFAQRYAMVVFYFATNGHDWLHRHSWLDPSKHECDWSDDIRCSHDGANHRIITGFDAPRNGLSGSLPSELFTLGAIASLRLSKNEIVGSIPSNIHQMTRLSALDLSHNQLTGPLPDTIGGARDLVSVVISENQINGSIPESFYDLSLLRTLDVSRNQITGTISNLISNLKVLDTLNLRHNNISGMFPSGLNEIHTLDHLWLDYNELIGSLPTISFTEANRLELTLSNNKISGSLAIDSSVRRRHLQQEEADSSQSDDFSMRLQKVDFSNNRLTGTISPLVAYLPTLRYVDISSNSFRGEFPGSSGGWPLLEHLNIARNDFTGSIPHGWPYSLEYFDVSGNGVAGTIPNELCSFPNLKFLKLCNNSQLEGTIPSCFDQASSLQHLEVQGNSMNGTIPWELSRLTNMQHLAMSGNALTGTIPAEFGQLTEMRLFKVRSNQLDGSIPSGFAEMRYLKELDLSGNRLTGKLPRGMGRLRKLEEVIFAPGNDLLRGRISDRWCLSATMNLTTTAVGCNIECSCCQDTESCGARN